MNRWFAQIMLLVLAAGVLTGCRRRPTYERRQPPIDGVQFAARSEVVAPGDSVLYVRVRALNRARGTRTLEWGACSMTIRVSTVGTAPPRSWDYLAWTNSQYPRSVCLQYLASRDLAPGDSVSPGEYTRRVPIRLILGDSLPPGRYRVTARVGANGRSTGDLDAGEVELR